MTTLKEMGFNRKVYGLPVQIEKTKDGIQRSQIIRDSTGELIGTINSDKWTTQVRAFPADKADTKIINVAVTGQSKDQAFADLRRWLVAYYFQLPELREMSL